MQPLLVPESLEATPQEVAMVEEHASELAQIGFDLEPADRIGMHSSEQHIRSRIFIAHCAESQRRIRGQKQQ